MARGSKAEAREMAERFAIGRGTLELAVLGIIRRGPQCGYQIAKELGTKDSSLHIPYGVLYPLLERMERRRLIKGRWEEGHGKKGLHVYVITPAGKSKLEATKSTWLKIIGQVRQLVGARA